MLTGASSSLTMLRTRTKRGWPRSLAAATLSLVLLTPASALADRRPGDVVGGRTLSSAPALEKVAPDISAPSGMLVTAGGGVLWERNAHKRMAMASTTKIMTAVVVLERAKLSDMVTVPKAAAAVAQAPVNLTPGETLSVQQLLEIMLVESANDAAYTLAMHVGGSVGGFAALMNEKAAQLGMKDTHYLNPHGLDVTGHYTTAADLVTLSRHAMRDAEFRRMVALPSVSVPGPKGQRRVFKTTDRLLSIYPGMEGIKTGFTNRAGYCLVSAARRGRVEIFGVVLHASSEASRFAQTRRLLDWGFRHYRETPVVTAGASVGTVPVSDWLDKVTTVKVAEATSAVLFDLAGPVTRRYALSSSVPAPVVRGQLLGVVTAYQGGAAVATAPIVAAASVAGPGMWDRFKIWSVRAWRGVFGPHEARTAIVTARD